MKVKPNHFYEFNPSFWDKVDPKTHLIAGDIVQVRNIFGCPPANTMGCCHVYMDGKFVGLVSTDSLVKERKNV